MIDFILKNLGTIIVSLVILLIAILAIRKLYEDKKNNKCSCGCDCGGCPKASTNCKE